MILIFTNKEDSHPTPVINHLKEWGKTFFRLNTECLLTDYVFEWWAEDFTTDFYIKNIVNGSEVYGHQITAVWDRRPAIPEKIYSTCSEEIKKYCLDEAHGFLSFLRYYLKDVFSIGSIVNDRFASSKMLQMRLAMDSGFMVPRTVFANRKNFVAKHLSGANALSLKPIDIDSVFFEGNDYVFYVGKHKTTDVLAQPESAFSQTASFIQEYIEKQYELRVTVCCGDIVACRIDSQKQNSGEGKEDWRQGYDYNLEQTIVDIPPSVKSSCLTFLDKMNLNFGCFDLIVTPNNECVFLECNPNGQWYWIEQETGCPISKIIAKHLCKK